MPVKISHNKNRKGGLCTQQITLLLFLGPNMYGVNLLVASAAEDNC